MREIELSIIVPVFNGERYIEKTIDNLLNIKNIKFEVLIINDGSKDKTKDIIQMKYKNNNKVNIISLKENKGVSYCRNIGIQKSKGQYITFMDVDDEVNVEMYVKLIEIAKQNNLDVCGCNYVEKNKDIEIKSKYIFPNKIIENEETVRLYLTDKLSPAIWDKIFKHNILEEIKFNEELQVGEDILFCLEIFMKTEKAKFINEYYYYYVQQETSVMHQISSKLAQFKNIEKCIKISDYNSLQKKYSMEFEYFKGAMIMRGIHSISMLKNRYNRKEAIFLISKIMNKEYLKKLIKNKYTSKSMKMEVRILLYLGIRMHLMLMPIYKYIRSKIRK